MSVGGRETLVDLIELDVVDFDFIFRIGCIYAWFLRLLAP